MCRVVSARVCVCYCASVCAFCSIRPKRRVHGVNRLSRSISRTLGLGHPGGRFHGIHRNSWANRPVGSACAFGPLGPRDRLFDLAEKIEKSWAGPSRRPFSPTWRSFPRPACAFAPSGSKGAPSPTFGRPLTRGFRDMSVS